MSDKVEPTSTPEGEGVDFHTFVMSLGTSAMYHLGEIPDPDTGERRVNLTMSRQTIDILKMIKIKTQGNLDSRETDILERLLYDLKIKFVARSGK
jgi:Domain of unknown function (DUF1844)